MWADETWTASPSLLMFCPVPPQTEPGCGYGSLALDSLAAGGGGQSAGRKCKVRGTGRLEAGDSRSGLTVPEWLTCVPSTRGLLSTSLELMLSPAWVDGVLCT